MTERAQCLWRGVLIAAASLLGSAPALAAPCDGRDVACTNANALVDAAIQAQPDLAGIAGSAETRRKLILSRQTPVAADAMNRDERLFRNGLVSLLTGNRFEGVNHRTARERLQGRWRSLDRMSAVSDPSVVGYWENSGGAVEIVQGVPGEAEITFFRRAGDGGLPESCKLEYPGVPAGSAWTFALPGDAPLKFSVHDGILWVAPYRGRNACARAVAGEGASQGASAAPYFAARPELHVPSPR